MLTVGSLCTIVYNSDNAVSDRTIIPTSVPNNNIKALDVTYNSDNEREKILDYFNEYKEYLELMHKQVFDFKTWVAHTKQEELPLKWRTFKVNKILSSSST